ncbi:MAG: hypothetical protein ACRDFB_10320, partial [Rhabdochlamydiaceae bacterium]
MTKSESQIQSDAIAYIATRLNEILNAQAVINDPNASTKYASAFIQQQEQIVADAVSKAMGVGMWLATRNEMTLTAWTDDQVTAN